FDLAFIQEPVINLVNLTTSNTQWNVIYPTCHNNNHAKCTRSLILINKQVLKEHWRTIPLNTPDVTTIEMNGDFGRIRIYNVYNDGTHGRTLEFLDSHL
ncbi:hypothetical protein PAXRUDRAFT_95134, partial [Paxillus rubicundulus Ve08.2h10]